MRKTLFLSLLVSLLASTATHAQTMRCGSELVSVGNRGFEILRKCGEPAYKDVVGYTLGSTQRIELRIEEWVYGPKNGMQHILRIEGNRLVSIESSRAP